MSDEPVAVAANTAVGTESISLGDKFSNFMSNAMENNPYFAAGGGLMLLGTGLAVAKTGMVKGSRLLYQQMIVDLEIQSKDRAYSWFLTWMSQYPKRVSKHLSVRTNYIQHDNGSVSTKFDLVPGPGNHWIRYKGAFILIKRERSTRMLDISNGSPYETVTLKTLYRDRDLFDSILREAKEMALKTSEGKTVIYTSFGPEWRRFGQPKAKRSLPSVILDKNIKDNIMKDVHDFLKNGKWYSDRGIPYRRGYLLYGPPGSGKTSFIQALAGELDYNICILNLSENNLTDDRLNHLMNNLPQRSILLLEDIDAAFNKRHQTSEQGFQSNVTFSGLLNALDGVTSSEETITFMTTNHPERLDSAILRPGRVDYKVFVGDATKYQVREMFLKFYPDERLLCEAFVKEILTLDKPVSTAQLQGLFVMNKDDPQSAVEMAPYIADPNQFATQR
ncbi:hypothetical protein Kpol_1062p18 [Vanderwaltozyma polyspora DSM 70294]|uniref:Mitochondrial chaperone BCS1 n=1 Tax=Vanderwaltozyma polyspora (strain ATCC 22028 / DSM 70294 / BCRC 21397 / CBS 2163 / NBRC 10782 / NRRL Y-8283 / UCD 57-17) TaxID=436907 RepID=A7TK75_VANPO|nr:uncharacterized protein Kpol_1062p18 [Vanderwaltozyma polyspora DSM 70294]EDO17310.1 hypothetical protein Kpol_1062p18 [Vanderwaltozyma polyspora DSM 70294]